MTIWVLNEYSTPAEVLQVAEREISDLMTERSEVVGRRASCQLKNLRAAAAVGGLAVTLIGVNLQHLVRYWQNRLEYAYRVAGEGK